MNVEVSYDTKETVVDAKVGKLICNVMWAFDEENQLESNAENLYITTG